MVSLLTTTHGLKGKNFSNLIILVWNTQQVILLMSLLGITEKIWQSKPQSHPSFRNKTPKAPDYEYTQYNYALLSCIFL